jgi:hypothetical protein
MAKGVKTHPVSEIILAAAQEVRDDEFGRCGRPFYLSAAQRALQEMNEQTSFYKKVFEAKIPDNLILDMPQDLTEKDMVVLFNGENCDYTRVAQLFIKPNMYHRGGEGYVANNMGANYDPLQWPLFWSQTPPQCLYFAGEHMGKLYFAPSCKNYDKVHITYTGLGMEDCGEDFEVPHWCRQAITDWVVHQALLRMEDENPNLIGRKIQRKEFELKNPAGSWTKAIMRYKLADKKGRYDITAYNHYFGHFP